MKYLFSIALMFLFFVGCGDNKDKVQNSNQDKNILKVDSSDISTSPVENPSENFFMRYALELNKDYKYRIATLSNNQQVITFDSAITQFIKQDIIYIITAKPVELDSDSILKVLCTFNSIKLEANSNGQSISYQSGIKLDSLDALRFANYEALINNPFNVRINSNGEIIEVFKTDKIISKYLNLQNLKDSIGIEEKNVLKEQISLGAIKPLLSQIFMKLPDKSFAKDSSWTVSQSPAPFLIFTLKNDNVYKIGSLEKYKDDKVAVINAQLKSEVSGSTNITEQGVNYKFTKPISEANGKIYFNVDKGYVQKSRIKSKLFVSFTMEGDTPTGKKKGFQSQTLEYTNIVELL